MAITFGSVMDTGTDASNTFTTGSVTPTAGNVTLLTFWANGNTATPSASGCNLTWTVATITNYSSTNMYVIWGVGNSPTTGTISVANLNGGTGTAWIVQDFSGVDTTTPFVQSNYASGSANPITVTLASSITYGNAAFGFGYRNVASNTYTAGTNFTLITTSNGNSRSVGTEYQLLKSDDAVIDMTASSNGSWSMMGIELKSAVSPSTGNFFMMFN